MKSATSSFSVSVDPGQLCFNAAHFITTNKSCENLHGHNFHVRIDACGYDDSDALVIDFVLINRIAEKICIHLNDKVLLPASSAEVLIEEQGEYLRVSSYNKQYVFPVDNCCLLPIGNATAEMLAWHICRQLLEALQRQNALGNLSEIEVAVEEADRQWGIYRQQVGGND